MTESSHAGLVDLVGVGLNATDTLIPLERFPERGSKMEYRSETILPGGQVASTVIACQHWGLRTRYVGKLGDDSAAALHHAAFAREGVETQIVTVPGGVSPQSLILVDAQGERTVLNRRDDRLVLQPEELSREWIVNARALHVDGHDTAAATLAAAWAREAGVPVVADLDELYPGVEELLKKIDYLIVSRDFPCRLMKEPDLETALRGMQKRYGSVLAAATLGQEGVLAWLEQHLQGFAGVLQAAAGFVFREQALVDGFFADVVDLVGEAGKVGSNAGGEQVVVDLVQQVAQRGGVAVAGADELMQALGQLLLDGFFEHGAAHDGAGGEEGEEVAAGSFVEIAVGFFRRGGGDDAFAQVGGAGYGGLDEVEKFGGHGGAEQVVLAGVEGTLDGFPGRGEAVAGLLQAGERGEALAGVLDEALAASRGRGAPIPR
jgi:sulfofructose kinase